MALRTSVKSVRGFLAGSKPHGCASRLNSTLGSAWSSRRRSMPVISPSAQEANLDNAFFKPACVIFDKDGTLVCFHTMWSPWCTSLAQRMENATGMNDISHHVYDVLGYDHREDRIKIGALAENTHPQIKDKIYEMLHAERGIHPREAKQIVDATWKDTPEDLTIKLTGNLHHLFHRLKSEGVKIAICTSDSQEGTQEFLHRQNLHKYIDMIVCGDDPEGKPKPNPHNAYYICDRLGVRPSDTIMVGDTPADTLMGQQAKLGLTVGVLSGVGNAKDLMDADVIVKDVQECVDLFLPHGEMKVHHITTRGLAKISRGSRLFHQNMAGTNPRWFSTSASRHGGYSHIIVGAGSAGCVLSNRLTEDRR